MAIALRKSPDVPSTTHDTLTLLRALERKVLWLSTWTIHHANHVRPNRDGLKVGGHQASCASATTLMTALYFHVLRPADRIAVKPHAAPVFHAIQYILGHQKREALENFRGFGGAQSYPSRTKDKIAVDFSTGSVGLGVGITLFASLVQDYLGLKSLTPPGRLPGRMVALMGDAELDEGNVFEALLEGWKQNVRNLWWIVDYNRQSLDGVVNDHLFQKIQAFFAAVGWNVVTLKYGKLLEAAFAGPGGPALRRWIDACPNDLYSALTFQGGATWRARLTSDLAGDPGIEALLSSHDDASLHRLMTNLAGHDMEALVEAFDAAAGDETPHCFVAYTVKGRNLPLAGHKDNHAGLMNPAQMAVFRAAHKIGDGAEWDLDAGLDIGAARLRRFLATVPLAARDGADRPATAPPLAMPPLAPPPLSDMSTQEGFGKIMNEIARAGGDFAQRVVTTSPDVTVSTNLGGWVNQTGIFSRRDRADIFRDQRLQSAQKWVLGPTGRHIELGIAENNLFLLLAALGLSERLFGARLLPVGTLYDPFIARGLDALNYACYQDSRFMLVATPSGISLAPEGGAHQSIVTPLIGMGQPGLAYFEPAYVDELHVAMEWGFAHMQAADGGSVYLRLSTRPREQPRRDMTPELRDSIIAGAYWLRKPAAGGVAVIASGAILPEAIEAVARIGAYDARVGLLAVSSPDRLYADWRERGGRSHIATLLRSLARDARLVTVLDGHPLTLSWIGAVRGQKVKSLGVAEFGQSGDIPELYRFYGIDADAIADAALSAWTDP